MDNAAMAILLEEQKTLFEGYKAQNDKRIVEIKELGDAKVATDEKLAGMDKRFGEIDKAMTAINRPDFQKLDKDGKPINEKAIRQAKVMDKFMRQGKDALTPDERKDMLVSDDTGGGFLATPEFVREIDKNIVEISPLRLHARVRTTGNRSVQAPTRTGTPTAEFVGEGKAPADSQTSYGLDTIHTHILAASVDVSMEDLEDSEFNLESEIMSDAAEQFAFREGEAFVAGNGENKPKGFTADTAIASAETTTSLLVDKADDIISLFFGIKSFYWLKSSFFMNRNYIEAVRKLKDVDEQYLWQPGLNGPTQMTLLGRPVVELPDMANTSSPAAGDIAIAFGDMRAGYWIIDRRQMAVVRDDLTQAKQGIVSLIFRKRVGGQTRRVEALRFLKLKA